MITWPVSIGHCVGVFHVNATVHRTSTTHSVFFPPLALLKQLLTYAGEALADKVGQCSWGQQKDNRGCVCVWELSGDKSYCSDIGRPPSVQLLFSSFIASPVYHSEKWLQLIHLRLRLFTTGCVVWLAMSSLMLLKRLLWRNWPNSV